VKLSFYAIVKNEAKNLGRCLASIQPYVDELIIIDTGSTDDTVAIAQQCGAKVSHFEWCDDFAAARNFAMMQAAGEWILALDADEELKIQNVDWTLALTQRPEMLAYIIPLKDIEGDASSLGAIRLFRNIDDFRYMGRYHESLYYQSQLLPLNHPQVSAMEGIEIIHYGYTSDSLSQKASTRISMLESIRAEEELSLLLLLTLAGLYKSTQSPEQYESCCSEAFERVLPNLLSGELPQDTRSFRSWLFCLGIQLLKHEDQETVQLICQRGVKWFPDYPPLFYLSGFFLKMIGFLHGSIPYFEKCLEAGHKEQYFMGEPFNKALITYDAAYELGTAFLELKQSQKAIAAFTLALSFDPNHVQAQEQLAIAAHQESAQQRLHSTQ
jgi:glycosyltransferase involved in cell wall biosynthesis